MCGRPEEAADSGTKEHGSPEAAAGSAEEEEVTTHKQRAVRICCCELRPRGRRFLRFISGRFEQQAQRFLTQSCLFLRRPVDLTGSQQELRVHQEQCFHFCLSIYDYLK